MHKFVFVGIGKKRSLGGKKKLEIVVTSTHVYVGACVGVEVCKKDRNGNSVFSL